MGAVTGEVAAAAGRGRGALVDREHELAALTDAVALAQEGTGRALLVTGVAGAGRSRLLREGVERARAAGCAVRSARGMAFTRDDELRVAGALLGGHDAALAATMGGAVAVLDRITADGPVVLVVDDLHLADEGSRGVIAALAQAASSRPVALLAATRADDARAWPGMQRLPVGPLGRRAVAATVRGTFGPAADAAFCRACAVQTAGNPRALRELLAAAAAAGVAPKAAGVAELTAIARRTAAHAVTATLAACSPEALRLACALGAAADDDLLPDAAALAGLDEEVAAAALAELVGAGLLRRALPPAFATPATAAAIAAAAPPGLWGAMHLAAARQRGAAPAGDVRTAEHLLHAPPRADAWVVAELRRAAAALVERGAPERAAVLLARALEEPLAPADEAAVTFELGLAEAACGSPGAAERMRHALELEDDPPARARVALALARLFAARGAYRRATTLIDEVARELAPADGRLAEELRAAIVSVDRGGGATGARARLGAVLAQAPDQDGPADRLVVVEAAHLGALHNRHCAELVALARRGWARGRLLDEETPESPAIAALSAVLCWANALEEDVAVLGQALATAQARGSVLAAATARACRAWPLLMLGRLDEACRDAREARRAERLGWAMFVATSRAVAAHVAIERGALAAAAEALALPADARWPSARLRGPYFAPYFDARARLRLAEGDVERAIADATAAGDVLARATGGGGSAFVPWRSTAAVAHARAGRADAALALAEEEVALAEASRNRRLLGIGLRTRGLVRAGADGVADLERSVAVLAGCEAALERWRSQLELGAALRRAGRRAASREPLRAALAGAGDAGAAAIATRAADELAASGGTVRRPAAAGRDADAAAGAAVDDGGALTPSERRVATLAAEGLTNREIAEELQVTAQTVGWHLGNVYRKLGVRRGGLADALRRA